MITISKASHSCLVLRNLLLLLLHLLLLELLLLLCLVLLLLTVELLIGSHVSRSSWHLTSHELLIVRIHLLLLHSRSSHTSKVRIHAHPHHLRVLIHHHLLHVKLLLILLLLHSHHIVLLSEETAQIWNEFWFILFLIRLLLLLCLILLIRLLRLLDRCTIKYGATFVWVLVLRGSTKNIGFRSLWFLLLLLRLGWSIKIQIIKEI